MSTGRCYTIGHSNHPIEKFLALLTRHGITCVGDVRSIPSSRFCPQFNGKNLDASLRAAGIAYLFLGQELGAKRREPHLLNEKGEPDYGKIRQTEEFHNGIARVMELLAADQTVVLLCAEKDPMNCHRCLMVTPALVEAGIEVAHILNDGTLIAHSELTSGLF